MYPTRSQKPRHLGSAAVILSVVILATLIVVISGAYGVTSLTVAATGTLVLISMVLNSARYHNYLCLPNAFGIGYFCFLFPESVLLAGQLEDSSIARSTTGTVGFFVAASLVRTALSLILLGALSYTIGGFYRSRKRRPLLAGTPASAKPASELDVTRSAWIAIVAFSLYIPTLLGAAGGAANALAAIWNRDYTLSRVASWYRFVPSVLAFCMTLALTFLFARAICRRQPAATTGYGLCVLLAAVLQLPYGNRALAFVGLIFPLFMWNYLKRRLSIPVGLILTLTLAVASPFLLALRTGRLGTRQLAIVDTDMNESSMVSLFAKALGALQTGELEYRGGRDLGLAVTWVVPRAWWPDKPWPLDYQLSQIFKLARNGQEFGTPVSVFGGLMIEFGVVGLVGGMALLGYGCTLLETKLSSSSFYAIAGRALLFCFVIDITRVGDLSREVGTATSQFICLVAVASVVLRRRSPEWLNGSHPIGAIAERRGNA